MSSTPLPRYSFLNWVTYNHITEVRGIECIKVGYLFNLLQSGFLQILPAEEREKGKFYPVAPLPAPDVLKEALHQQALVLVVAQDHGHLVPVSIGQQLSGFQGKDGIVNQAAINNGLERQRIPHEPLKHVGFRLESECWHSAEKVYKFSGC